MYNVPFADECRCTAPDESVKEITFTDEMNTTHDILVKSFFVSNEIAGRLFGKELMNGEPKLPELNSISDNAIANKSLAVTILETLNNIQRRLG